jgi:Cadherin domain
LPNYLVMTVKATDGDTGDNGRISYHLKDRQGALIQETEEFTINSETGELRTKVILDREHQAKYEVTFCIELN